MELDRRKVLTAGVVAAVTAVSAGAARAQGGNDQDIVGSWFGTVTATNPPLGQFNDLISFHTGGVVTESRRYAVPGTPFGTLLETSAHGAWKRTAGHAYEAFFRFLLQNLDTGAPIGTDNVRLFLTLNDADGTLTGTFESQIKDTADILLLTVTGDYSATPITV
jgi:hypothetical protein